LTLSKLYGPIDRWYLMPIDVGVGKAVMRVVAMGLAAVMGLASLVGVEGRAAAAPPAGGMTGAQLTDLFATYGNTSGRWSGADSRLTTSGTDCGVADLVSDPCKATPRPVTWTTELCVTKASAFSRIIGDLLHLSDRIKRSRKVVQ